MRFALLLFLAILLLSASAAQAVHELEVVRAFEGMPPGAEASPRLRWQPDLRTEGVVMPGYGIHPGDTGETFLHLGPVALPGLGRGERLFLLFHLGMSDGIRWDSTDPKPNGARFTVHVDGIPQYTEIVAEPGWRMRALDLSAHAGSATRLAFSTDCIDGNTAYDWAILGQPMVVRLVMTDRDIPLGEPAAGAALGRLRCEDTAVVRAQVGEEEARTATFPRGLHWFPVPFTLPDPPRFEVTLGTAEVVDQYVAFHQPRLRVVETAPSSLLRTADHPGSEVTTVSNEGLGHYRGGTVLPQGGEVPGPIAPGGLGYVTHNLSASDAFFGATPDLPGTRPDSGALVKAGAGNVAGLVATPQARLVLIVEQQRGYAVAETWNGRAWQRVGTLYPLAAVATPGKAPGALRVLGVHAEDDELRIIGATGGHEIRITWRPEPGTARIHLTHELRASKPGAIAAFRGPTVLAGDRAFGARKDFALFPGLEYLEQDEPSSSTRDLAPPLNDRRVPAPHKITVPLMAAQGDDALIALLWDMKREWTPGQAFPAARFDAPPLDAGRDYLHMALSAPGVGPFREENHFEASTPFPLNPGDALRLESTLVLEHKSNYGPGSIVQGLHRSGLLLQAVRHWYDNFGLPEPSPAPRGYDESRALSRVALLDTAWQEAPPGWRGHTGVPGAPSLPAATVALMEIADGVPAAEEAELQRRVDLVVARALAEYGPSQLWKRDAHILFGEFPFTYGYLPENLAAMSEQGRRWSSGRNEEGLMVWRSPDRKHRSLGPDGGHALGIASFPTYLALRSARFSGNWEAAKEGLVTIRQFGRYEVPRGAAMWECPMYQPGMLAGAQAMRALVEAYTLTRDEAYLDRARFWAWTSLPFVYTWGFDDNPTMRYNVVSDFGSTFHTHSWIGVPVVWCGLVYAYGLQELARYDDSFPWLKVARGITHSALWQQYAHGPSMGCYPDSWDNRDNHANPVDIRPEAILANLRRLDGISPHVRTVTFGAYGKDLAVLNSMADIDEVEGSPGGELQFCLQGGHGDANHAVIAPVARPARVKGAGDRVKGSEALLTVKRGWLYDEAMRMLVVKTGKPGGRNRVTVVW